MLITRRTQHTLDMRYLQVLDTHYFKYIYSISKFQIKPSRQKKPNEVILPSFLIFQPKEGIFPDS